MSTSKKQSEKRAEKSEIRSPENEPGKTSRRKFLSVGGALAVGSALSGCQTIALGPTVKPTTKWTAMTAKSYAGIIGANDRIRIGFLGTGGMGTGQIREIHGRDGQFAKLVNAQVTAVSDVYKPRLERASKTAGGAKGYHDYRDLLTSGMVDGVVIASPEHWHHRMALDSLKAGMDVYLQKPMTRNHAEALDLYKAFSASDRIFQLGSQYCQTPAWWKAKELYESGDLGRVVMSQTSYHRNSKGGEWNYSIDKDCRIGVGGNLDWDRWLGAAPYVDYDPEYYFRWRKYRKFSGGIITDLLPHKIHSLAYVIGAKKPPLNVTCVGGIYVHLDRTVADTVAMTIDYGDSVMIVTGATCNERGLENIIRGHEATLYIGENTVRMAPERPYADELDLYDEKSEPARLSSGKYHLKEFFDSMRSRKQPTWDVESTYNVMTAITMAETALYDKRTVHYDPASHRIS